MAKIIEQTVKIKIRASTRRKLVSYAKKNFPMKHSPRGNIRDTVSHILEQWAKENKESSHV